MWTLVWLIGGSLLGLQGLMIGLLYQQWRSLERLVSHLDGLERPREAGAPWPRAGTQVVLSDAEVAQREHEWAEQSQQRVVALRTLPRGAVRRRVDGAPPTT